MKFQSAEKESKVKVGEIYHDTFFNVYRVIKSVEWKTKLDYDFYGDYDVDAIKAELPGYQVNTTNFNSEEGALELSVEDIAEGPGWDMQTIFLKSNKLIGEFPKEKLQELEEF